jgi:hypothetical protein
MKRQLLAFGLAAASAIGGLSFTQSAHAQVVQETESTSFFDAMRLSASTKSNAVAGTLLGGRTGRTDHQDFYRFNIPVGTTLELCYNSSAGSTELKVKSFDGRFVALGDIPRCTAGTKKVGVPPALGGIVSFYAQFELTNGPIQVPQQKSYSLAYKLQPTVK